MYKVETDRTLCRLMKMFYRLGIWRNEEESAFRKSFMRLLFMLENTLFIIFNLICAYLSDVKDEQIFQVEMAIVGTVLGVKLWFLLYRMDEFLQFLSDPIVTHCSITDYDESMKVNKKVKNIQQFIAAYCWFIIVANSFLIVISWPIFTNQKMLPMFIRFDIFHADGDHEMILYWMTNIYTSVGNFYYVVYNFMIVFIWYIMFNFAIEYNLLGDRLRRLGHTTKAFRSNKTTQNSFEQHLMGLIAMRKKIFNTVERFRSCFSSLFLAEIFTGAISICCITYNLAYSSSENKYGTAYWGALLLYAILDVFLVMYMANEITLESDQLPYCLFESNWIEQPQATKKYIIIWCEMTKQPQRLIIWIYPMNLEKFTSIINGAYSMFNILNNVNQ